MNFRLVVRLVTAMLAVALVAIPAQAATAKGKGKDKPLIVCSHGCKYKTIQKAVDKAKKGDTIAVLPGKYVEGVVVEGHKLDGLTIEGMKQKKNGKLKKANPKKVILEGKNAKTPDGSTANNGIEGAGVNDLTVKNLWARNYGANGIFVHDPDIETPQDNGKFDCNDYLFKNTIVSFNRAYGLFAFGCRGGRMTKSTGYGHGDSAFYVGASPPQDNPKPTRLDHLDGHENVLGYSGTNSRYVTIEKSNFYNNGVGVVPNTLDSEPFEPSADSVIRNNNIFWNNFNYFLPNSRVETVSDGLGELGGQTIQYPTGVGIVLLGTDGWTIEHNNIFGNFMWGSAIVADPQNDGDDAIPFNNQFLNNQNGRSGTDTNAVDFFNEGAGSGNCFSGNVSTTFDPSSTADMALLYPPCPPTNTTDPNGQTGDSSGNIEQFVELFNYVTTDPPENQECSWTKHSHPDFQDYEPLTVTPGPDCGP
jgi:hypothetical protein